MTDDRARHAAAVPQPGSTPAPESQQQVEPGNGDGADLLSIGLLVFFVALLLIVAAMLALPMLLG